MNLPSTLQVVADEAEALRDNNSAAELGRKLGHATSTITRRSHLPVVEWPACEVLVLAGSESRLAAAIQAALAGQQAPRGDSQAVQADLVQEVEASHGVAASIRTALTDGELRTHEIDQIVASLERRRETDARLIRDLRAKRKEARP